MTRAFTFTVALLAVLSSTTRGQNFLGRGAVVTQTGGVLHEPFAEPMTAAKIRDAIDDAVLFLRARQAKDGSIEDGHAQGGGTALAALAILASGANPASDEQLQKALDWLAKIEPNNTYVRGIRANVWEYALRKVPHDEKYRAMLKTDVSLRPAYHVRFRPFQP